ncbi:MAG: glycosyl hydrolase [Acidipila sp.]|nr:glycosyl hydrolase [Acidipila sp.]
MALGLALVALLGSSTASAQQYDNKLLEGMKYRLVGPYRGGRSVTAVGLPGDPNTYYFGAAAGGVWKTTNGGLTWSPLFDKQAVSSIGSLAVAASDLNIVYVGTGEACIRGNISQGDGVYKSLDAGKTWTNIGLRDTRAIGRVIVHPTNPAIVYVAALGHPYGKNAERGVFRTTDGGKTWEKLLYVDDKTGAIDVQFDPTNPHILFAAMWEAGRTPWGLTSGGPGSGIYKSSDGGNTWKHLQGNGLPSGLMGKINISVSGADSNRVYAMIEAEEEAGGLYRSDDGGEKWTHVTDDHRLRHRPWYYDHLTADPKNADTIYVLNLSIYRSTDGGKTYSILRAPHGDHHSLWIDPNNPKRMINANDGGVTITVDGGASWTPQTNQPTAQFYHVAADNHFPYYLYGAQQDNTTVGIASRSDWGAIGRSDWNPVGGGESGYATPNPMDANIVYAGDYFGILTRYDRRTNQAQDIMVWPDDADGHAASDMKYRFQWTEPIVVSPHDPHTLYYAGNILFKSTNEGMSWTAISPDLTRNDKSKQQRSGGPITGENLSVEYYDTIFTFAESPVEKDLLWVGTDDGLVHVSRDGGKNWTNVTPKEMPEWSMVSILDASPHDAGTAYVAVDRHKFDDLTPFIYKTHDFGKTWTKITTGIAENTFVRAVREDPKRKALLYAGTETGIYVSFDDGARWQPLQLNLPTTPIHDLVVKEGDLAVATHGRSFWILDDLSPLRQMSDNIAKAEAHLFTPANVYRVRSGHRSEALSGENPPDGAILYYYLKNEPKDEITIDILDAAGKVIRKYSSREKIVEGRPLPEREESKEDSERLPTSAGMHRFVWNLRYQMPELVPNAIYDIGDPVGPLALPGNYSVRLTVAGKSYTAPVEVKLDPRVTTSFLDLKKSFELHAKLRDLLGEDHDAVMKMRSLRVQLDALRKRLESDPRGAALAATAQAIDTKMALAEAELIEVKAKSSQDMDNYPTKLSSKIVFLLAGVDSSDSAPTEQEGQMYEELRKQVNIELGIWKGVLEHDLAELNQKIEQEKFPAVGISAVEKW